MNIICDKCGASEVYVEMPEPEKEVPRKMTDFTNLNVVPLVYKTTTLRCKRCGFSHTY